MKDLQSPSFNFLYYPYSKRLQELRMRDERKPEFYGQHFELGDCIHTNYVLNHEEG